MSNIYKVLDRLLTLLEEAPAIPFTGNRLVNIKLMQDIIEKAVAELPSELASSKEVLEREEYILKSAREKGEELIDKSKQEAEQILNAAKNQVAQMLSQSEIIKAVNEEAEKIRQQVRAEAHKAYEITEKELSAIEKRNKLQMQMQMEEAMQEANTIRQSAYTYAKFILEQMEKLTKGSLDVIENGRTQLEDYALSHSLPGKQDVNKYRPALSGN